MKILLMGPQGCGKGTIGKMLSEKLGLPLIEVGGLLRAASENNPNYKNLAEYLNKGKLAPYGLTADIIIEKIASLDSAGYILDGWCRAMDELPYFDPKPDIVIVLNISRETSIKRITGRRICDSDGKTYNIYTLPKDELEKCAGNLVQRADDTEEAVNQRLAIYYNETTQVIEYYKKQGKVLEVSAEPLPDEILENILSSGKIRPR